MLVHAHMSESTFGSSTKAAHGINWENSVMVASVVCDVQSLESGSGTNG